MSQVPLSSGIPGAPSQPPLSEDEKAKSIYLVSYPKVVFLYPTFVVALIAGLFMSIAGAPPQAAAPPADQAAVATAAETPEKPDALSASHILATVFLLTLTFNMIVLSFDFPRTTSLTLFFFVSAIILGLLLLFRFNEDILPFLHRLLKAYKPWANATFYFSFAGVLGLIYLAVLINVQFDYWEVTPNELLHHHGFLSNLQRYAAPSLKIDKEINDVFEYGLLRSGRLILHPSTEPRAIVLENVMRINTKEAQLTRLLGALQVQVRQAPPG
ncbi:MAG: hypothetical protein ACKV0T_22470 [Planctomycetales bacterium]